MNGLSRRGLLLGGAAGLTTGVTGTALALYREPQAAPVPVTTEPFHGPHQAGITTPPQTHAVFLALDLRHGVDRTALGRLMRILTDDAARLTQGEPALADTEPELATATRLTVTFGFGPGLYRAAGLDAPIAPLPAFRVDRLEDRWSGGDLLLQLCAEDGLTLAHAQRMLVKDTRAFATVRWAQRGFRDTTGGTGRNVLGQVDGTGNPAPGTPGFDAAIWRPDGGTTLVLRRIRAELETWDAVDRPVREMAVGRRLDNGAPLTGTAEHDAPDFGRRDDLGLPVIHPDSHVRLATVGDPALKILRRPYNYDDGPRPDGTADAGLIFAAYQADAEKQFTPIQRALAERDLLNQWITPIGSAVFAIPPGCEPGGWIGETVLA